MVWTGRGSCGSGELFLCYTKIIEVRFSNTLKVFLFAVEDNDQICVLVERSSMGHDLERTQV